MHKRLFASLTLAMAMLVANAAYASNITLDNPGFPQFQQTQNSPCIIGNPSCNNSGGFLYTLIPVNWAWDTPLDSPTYTVGQVRAILAGTNDFWVGIDVNTAGATKDAPNADLADESLRVFEVWINGNKVFDYTPGGAGTRLRIPNNGNGYSDDILKGMSLSGFTDAMPIFFHANITGATDGREQLFLIPVAGTPDQHCTANCIAATPEPASLVLLGTGLAAAALALRRRAKA